MKIKKIDDFKLNESEKVKDDDDYCAEYGFLIEKELHLKNATGYFDFMYTIEDDEDYDKIVTYEFYFDYIIYDMCWSFTDYLNKLRKYSNFKILSGNHDNFTVSNLLNNQICIKFETSLGIVKEKRFLF
jgi:hypothetical protein